MQAESTALIPLRDRAGNVVAHAVVDAEDAERLNRYRWSLTHADRRGGGYAVRGEHVDGRLRVVRMHRAVLGLPSGRIGVEVDHINHRTLDNRKSNLRAVTHAENTRNRQAAQVGARNRLRGAIRTQSGKWRARVTFDGRNEHLGTFATEEEAAAVAAARRAALEQEAAQARH